MSQGHRTVEISWLPTSPKAWATFSTARIEAARLWNDLINRHADLGQHHLNPTWPFPTLGEWQAWAKGKYPLFHSQTTQQSIGEFLEACRSTLAKRKEGYKEASFPWRHVRYRDIPYTNQGARVRNGFLILPNGNAGELCVAIPDGIILPEGRLINASEISHPDGWCGARKDRAHKALS